MTVALRQRPLARVVMGIVKSANGAWFDPSDLSTLYQDSAGTTPVTAVEQPVGLILDKSQGLMLGPELWIESNGVYGEASIISSNEYRIYSSAGSDAGAQSATGIFTIGRVYKVTFSIISVTVAGGGLRSGSAGAIINPTIGYKEVLWFANATSFALHRALGATDIQIGNLSIKELYGYHATQSVTASRPTLSARKNLLVATETLSTQSVTTLAAKYCLSFWGTGSITLSGTSTGVLQGTGAGNRVWVEFTTTAGTLTLTVAGTVSKAQLELTS